MKNYKNTILLALLLLSSTSQANSHYRFDNPNAQNPLNHEGSTSARETVRIDDVRLIYKMSEPQKDLVVASSSRGSINSTLLAINSQSSPQEHSIENPHPGFSIRVLGLDQVSIRWPDGKEMNANAEIVRTSEGQIFHLKVSAEEQARMSEEVFKNSPPPVPKEVNTIINDFEDLVCHRITSRAFFPWNSDESSLECIQKFQIRTSFTPTL